MNEFLIIKLLHIICFVYWLGGDLGTYYASRFVARSDISPESRNVAMTIMMGCDQGPRFAMPIILPLGFHLGHYLGVFTVSSLWLAIIYTLCILWGASVLIMHFWHNSNLSKLLGKIDFQFRLLIGVSLVGLAIYGLMNDTIITSAWFSYKLLIFAGLVFMGLMIRVNLKPLIAAWGQLQSKGPTDELNTTIQTSLGRCTPYVHTIWLGLLVNAAIGLHIFG